MMLANIMSTFKRARAADTDEGGRGTVALARYAIFALVALSILPASAAQLHAVAQDNSERQGEAESKQPSEQRKYDSAERTRQTVVAGYADILQIALIEEKQQRTDFVWNDLRFDASGKRPVMKLEMSRQELGNLLIEKITPN